MLQEDDLTDLEAVYLCYICTYEGLSWEATCPTVLPLWPSILGLSLAVLLVLLAATYACVARPWRQQLNSLVRGPTAPVLLLPASLAVLLATLVFLLHIRHLHVALLRVVLSNSRGTYPIPHCSASKCMHSSWGMNWVPGHAGLTTCRPGSCCRICKGVVGYRDPAFRGDKGSSYCRLNCYCYRVSPSDEVLLHGCIGQSSRITIVQLGF